MLERLTTWGARLLAGMTLLFFSEIVWWSNDPLAYDGRDWLALVALYLIFGALVLDLLTRLRIGEMLGLLMVAGLYGLLDGALVSHSAFANLPASLVSRPLGLHTLGGGVLALVALAWMLDGRGFDRGRAAAVGAIGLLSGVWIRWYPLLPSNDFPVPGLPAALLTVGGGLIVLGGIGAILMRLAPGGRADFRLGKIGWVIVAGALLLAFWVGSRHGAIGTAGSAALGLLLGYMVIVLYFLRGQKRESFLSRLTPFQPVSIRGYGLYGLLLIGGLAVGYNLPGDGPDGPPLQLLTSALTVFGAVWLPAASLGIGLRAYVRLFRQQG